MADVILIVERQTETTLISFPWFAASSCNFKKAPSFTTTTQTQTYINLKHHQARNSNNYDYYLVENDIQAINEQAKQILSNGSRNVIQDKQNTHKNSYRTVLTIANPTHRFEDIENWYYSNTLTRTLTQTRSFDSILTMMMMMMIMI